MVQRKQVNLKETFEETAARRVGGKTAGTRKLPTTHVAQSPIVVASASNAAASRGITSMDVDDEAASKETNSGSLNVRARRVRRRANTSRKSIRARMREIRRRIRAAAANVDEKAKPSAGARWTKDEGGFLQNSEPTMTFCTKEAWGDVMAMFSDRGKGARRSSKSPITKAQNRVRVRDTKVTRVKVRESRKLVRAHRPLRK